MAASSKLMISEAEQRFPVRIRLALPAGGFGTRLSEIHAWLDENCGADGWAMTPSGVRGMVNDAVAVYFRDPTLASGFVARWCAANKVETARRSLSGQRGCADAADRREATRNAVEKRLSRRGCRRIRHRASHLARRLVVADALVDDLPQQALLGPGEVLHFNHKLGPYPMHAG